MFARATQSTNIRQVFARATQSTNIRQVFARATQRTNIRQVFARATQRTHIRQANYITVYGVKLWNTLQENTKTSKHIYIFKTLYKNKIYKKYPLLLL